MDKKVKILLMGDSITEGDGNPSAYRFQFVKNLFRAGAIFQMIGPKTGWDCRLSDTYIRHGATCGHIIGSEALEKNSLRYNLTQEPFQAAVKEADILCLWIGFNDHYRKLNEGVEARYLKLLDCLYELNPTLSVYCSTLWHEESPLNPFLRSFDTEEYARKYGRKLTVTEVCKSEYMPVHGTDDFPEDDGHPTEKGNIKVGKMWADAVLAEVLARNAKGTGEDDRVRVTGIQTDMKKTLTLRPNEGVTVHASVLPENAEMHTVLYSSSNPAVLSVGDYGKAIAHKEGTAVLRAESLDGAFYEETLVTVAGAPLSYGEGLCEILSEDFTDESRWEGSTEKLAPAYRKLAFRWNGEPKGTLTHKKELAFGDTVYFEFTYWTANDSTRSRERYFSITVGGVELRISGGAKYASLYENGMLLAEEEALPAVFTKAAYAVLHAKDKVMLYCNNELVAEASVACPPASGHVEINFDKLTHKTYVSNLTVKTK